MQELCDFFHQKADEYIQECDKLYAYLVEPYVSFDLQPKETSITTMPKPLFIDSDSNTSMERKLSDELFKL